MNRRSNKPLLVLLVLILCGVAFGFYRGWFALTSPQDTESNKVNINLTVDPDKVKEDAQKVKDKTTGHPSKGTKAATELNDQPRD